MHGFGDHQNWAAAGMLLSNVMSLLSDPEALGRKKQFLHEAEQTREVILGVLAT